MHEALGPEARWRRFMADVLRVMASGKRIDPNRTQTYGEILKEVYRDPFLKRQKEPQTAEEIIGYISRKLEDLLNGSVKVSRKNRA